MLLTQHNMPIYFLSNESGGSLLCKQVFYLLVGWQIKVTYSPKYSGHRLVLMQNGGRGIW